MRDIGADVLRGDYDDWASLDAALHGVYGVFLPGFQASARNLLETETRYGAALIEAAKQAAVRHLVYASKAGPGDDAPRYLQSKRRVEAMIRERCLPATILRHAFYLDWLLGAAGPRIWKGLNAAANRGRLLQVIARDDAGAFAAHIFDNPDRYIGKQLDLAGGEIAR